MAFECKRCGNCCNDVGRTFWKNGNYEDVDSWLDDWANDGDHEDGSLPCEMLHVDNGVARCFIQWKYGKGTKPLVCREHEGDERCPSCPTATTAPNLGNI